ncbi:MAG TPA: hypothetical protein VHK00_09470 [Miltoncostaeaceae bacterium]|jgi:hypothetical protein|nr:hypothetical protein [Miltoncostaeaceae bacterium]
MTGSTRRWRRAILVGLAVVVVAAAAAAANLLLLDAAGEDRLGRLRPIDPALGAATTAPAREDAPRAGATTPDATPPAPTAADDDDGDAGRGRGRGRGGGDD